MATSTRATSWWAADGEVRLIDFGLSLHRESPAARPGAGGGLLPRARVRGGLCGPRIPPGASAVGEQYALAALLYLLFTGAHYPRFQAGPGGDAPADRRGAAPWPFANRPGRRSRRSSPGPGQGSRRALPLGRRIRACPRRRRTLRNRRRAGPGTPRPRPCSPGCSIGSGRRRRSSARGSPSRRAPRSPTAPPGSPAASTGSPWPARTPGSSPSPTSGPPKAARRCGGRRPSTAPAEEITRETVGRVSPYHTGLGRPRASGR